MAKQRCDVVNCCECGKVKHGGIVYYDKTDPTNLDKQWAVCDDCNTSEEEN